MTVQKIEYYALSLQKYSGTFQGQVKWHCKTGSIAASLLTRASVLHEPFWKRNVSTSAV